MSRWAKALGRAGFDFSDALFLAGTVLVGGGLGWALAPAWGVVAVGLLLLMGYLLQFVAAVLAARKGGGD